MRTCVRTSLSKVSIAKSTTLAWFNLEINLLKKLMASCTLLITLIGIPTPGGTEVGAGRRDMSLRAGSAIPNIVVVVAKVSVAVFKDFKV